MLEDPNQQQDVFHKTILPMANQIKQTKKVQPKYVHHGKSINPTLLMILKIQETLKRSIREQ